MRQVMALSPQRTALIPPPSRGGESGHFLVAVFVAALFLAFALLSLPVLAQDGDEAAIYKLTDVAADVTADSAAHARDKAIMQAQRSAFEQLLTRLGVDAARAARENDDGIAALVQAFEVQREHASAVRYIGTFTIQFKPNAVRALLNKEGASFNEERSRPLVALPIVNKAGRNILWEDSTKWRSVWESATLNVGRVPLLVPQGGLDDVAIISADEAANGKAAALQNLMQKYQAGGALVAVLNADPDQPNPKQPLRVTVTRYDESGRAADPIPLTLPTATDAKTMLIALNDAIRQIRSGLENNWQEISKTPQGPLQRLPVSVPLVSLTAWNDIKTRLGNIPAVSRANVVTLARGVANIELEYRGDMPQLQAALAQQHLILQAGDSGAWTLHTGVASP